MGWGKVEEGGPMGGPVLGVGRMGLFSQILSPPHPWTAACICSCYLAGTIPSSPIELSEEYPSVRRPLSPCSAVRSSCLLPCLGCKCRPAGLPDHAQVQIGLSILQNLKPLNQDCCSNTEVYLLLDGNKFIIPFPALPRKPSNLVKLTKT